MKKIFSLIIIAVSALMANAQSVDNLNPIVIAYNAKCPIEVADGTTLKQVEMTDDGLVFTHTVTDQLFDNLEGLKTILHDSLLAELESTPDKNTQALVAICKSTKTNIIQRFVNSKGQTFNLIILPTEL